MNPAEIIIILFIMFVLALVGTGHLQSRDEAELAHDVSVVRDVALQYANLECSSPVGAVTLNSAGAALGDCETIGFSQTDFHSPDGGFDVRTGQVTAKEGMMW